MAYNSIVLRFEIDHREASFGDLAAAMSKAGGDITSIDVIRPGQETSIRDITVDIADSAETEIVERVKQLAGIKLINVSDRTFLMHIGGKISIQPNMPIKNRDDLSRAYTPGVARVCTSIYENPLKAYTLTIKRNTVAVVNGWHRRSGAW